MRILNECKNPSLSEMMVTVFFLLFYMRNFGGISSSEIIREKIVVHVRKCLIPENNEHRVEPLIGRFVL